MPAWTLTLRLAHEWGKTPEEIEEKASALWVDRWLAVEEAKQGAEPQTATPGAVTQQGDTQKRRLI